MISRKWKGNETTAGWVWPKKKIINRKWIIYTHYIDNNNNKKRKKNHVKIIPKRSIIKIQRNSIAATIVVVVVGKINTSATHAMDVDVVFLSSVLSVRSIWFSILLFQTKHVVPCSVHFIAYICVLPALTILSTNKTSKILFAFLLYMYISSFWCQISLSFISFSSVLLLLL